MGTTNFGSQVITLDYGAPVISTSHNRRNREIIPTGIYRGGYLAITTPNNFSISQLVCEIRDEAYQVQVVTTAPITLASDPTKPYVVLRWAYAATPSPIPHNYMDALIVAAGDVHANDLVVGKCVFVGSNLTGFVYDDSTFFRTTPNCANVFLRVEPEDPVAALRVWVRAGRIVLSTGNGTLFIGDVNKTFDTADASQNRVDLVYVNDTGVNILKGTAGAGVPSYGSRKVLAEVTIRAAATTILASDIKDVRSFF